MGRVFVLFVLTQAVALLLIYLSDLLGFGVTFTGFMAFEAIGFFVMFLESIRARMGFPPAFVCLGLSVLTGMLTWQSYQITFLR